jgi:hypothetical protein
MIPSWMINIGTLPANAVRFAIGWLWRGWREREKAEEMLRKAGIKVEPPDR